MTVATFNLSFPVPFLEYLDPNNTGIPKFFKWYSNKVSDGFKQTVLAQIAQFPQLNDGLIAMVAPFGGAGYLFANGFAVNPNDDRFFGPTYIQHPVLGGNASTGTRYLKYFSTVSLDIQSKTKSPKTVPGAAAGGTFADHVVDSVAAFAHDFIKDMAAFDPFHPYSTIGDAAKAVWSDLKTGLSNLINGHGITGRPEDNSSNSATLTNPFFGLNTETGPCTYPNLGSDESGGEKAQPTGRDGSPIEPAMWSGYVKGELGRGTLSWYNDALDLVKSALVAIGQLGGSSATALTGAGQSLLSSVFSDILKGAAEALTDKLLDRLMKTNQDACCSEIITLLKSGIIKGGELTVIERDPFLVFGDAT